jgi:hypothetical protein
VHRMIEQSIVHLPELGKDIDRSVSIYLVHLSSPASRAFRALYPTREHLGALTSRRSIKRASG